MNFDKLVEAKIKEAQDRGEFDNLSGKGKPLDLTEYFEAPEELRMAQTILKNAGMTSPEVELLKKIAELKENLVRNYDENKKLEIRKEIESKQIEFNMLMERMKRQTGKM